MSIRSRFVGSFLSLAMIGAGPVADGASWTVPGIVNASGLNGTKFVSDISLTNPGTAPAEAVVSFLPASGAGPKTLSLSPGQTLVSRNVVSSLFGLSGGAGAVSISSDQALLVRARTYNTAASGTYGVSLPVFADDRLLSPGDSGDALWISQDASGSSGYRTNVALVFPDPRGGAAIVTVHDADGSERGRQEFSLDVPGLQQFSVGSFAGAVSVARAQVVVTRGRAAGYAVVVDNVTGDSSLFAFEDLPGGRQDVLVNGVARASGRNNAFFRTDGRFYNPTDTEATVRVSFHASANANPSPATASFTLPAGKIRDVVDVLDALLDLPVGSAGALRFESDWPVAILCRTSNVDPSGARPGTFGSQQKPVSLLSFVTSADAGAAITGIRQDTNFRTNVGFAAGGDGARYSLTLSNASGGTIATSSGSLGAWGWSQPNVQDLFPSSSIPADATLQVRVTEGSLDVFDSSIDNLSGDPVVTPIAPIPVAIASSATIGPAGGSIRSSDGRLTLRVPAGALSQPVPLAFQTTTNTAPQGTGAAYQLSPSGITFLRPALLTLAYGRADTESSSAEALILAQRAGADWTILWGGTVDAARHTLTVPLPATAPPAAAQARGRTPAVDPYGVIALANSWVLVPKGRQRVVAGGHLPFSVRSVGGGWSSSIVPAVLSDGVLSSSPSEVQAVWFVNNLREDFALDGRIIHTGGALSVVYEAPSCSPRENPVLIYARLANNIGFPRPWYMPATVATVRVVPRDWKLTVDPLFTVSCDGIKNEASDVVTWPEGMVVDFRLKEDFTARGTFELPKPASHRREACRTCADGSRATLEDRGTDSEMYVDVIAQWNPDSDLLGLYLNFVYEGPTSLWSICRAGKPENLVDEGFAFGDEEYEDVWAGLSWTLHPLPEDSQQTEIRLSLREACR